MEEIEALAWSEAKFGLAGARIRERVPKIIVDTHMRYVAIQKASGLSSAEPYGMMWLAAPRMLIDGLRDLPGFETYHPPYARYSLPRVGGVPIVPWRYAKDGTTDFRAVPFGRPVSTPKRGSFRRAEAPLQLPFDEGDAADEAIERLDERQRNELDALAKDIRATAAAYDAVMVVAYASNPDAILKMYLGYATLGGDDLLAWHDYEEIAVAMAGLTPPHDASGEPPSSFASGPLPDPPLRPRTPLEGPPSTEPEPPSAPTETGTK